MRVSMIGVLEQDAVHIRGGILEELSGSRKDNQADFTVTKHRQLICLLHETKFTLREGHLQEAI